MENRDTFEFGFTDSSDRIEKSISPREKRIERKVEMVVEFEGEGRGGEGREGKISEERTIVARYSPRGNGIGAIVDRSLAEPLSPLNMAVYGESRFSKTLDER